MMEFEAGAIFGACLTMAVLLFFMTVFGREDDEN